MQNDRLQNLKLTEGNEREERDSSCRLEYHRIKQGECKRYVIYFMTGKIIKFTEEEFRKATASVWFLS